MVSRNGKRVLLNRTKSDAPALNLFVGDDSSWVLWTPQGFYDSSIAGDQKYLVWHRNRATPDLPTLALPAIEYEAHFRKPELVERLIATADPRAVLASYDVRAEAVVIAPRRLHAVTVGLGAFRDERIEPVPFAGEDARDIASALERAGIVRGFEEVVTQTLNAQMSRPSRSGRPSAGWTSGGRGAGCVGATGRWSS